jgi:hypothetical protein
MDKQSMNMSNLSPWQTDKLAGWRIGDHADVHTLGRVEVVALRPPREVEVRVKSGKTCRVGFRALRRIQTDDEVLR